MRNRTENQIKLLFIRHGMTDANREHRYLGRTEEPLSQEGRHALLEARGKGAYPETDMLFSSPMKRCLETAQILYPDRQAILVPEWKEMDFGAFEGKNYQELQGDARYQAWIDSNGTLPFPDGESREGFIERCARGLERMWEQLFGTEEPFRANQLSEMEQMTVPGLAGKMRLTESGGLTQAELLSEKIQSAEADGTPARPPGAERIKGADRELTIGLIVHGGTIMALLSRYCGGEYFDYQVPNGGGYVCTVGGISEEDGPCSLVLSHPVMLVTR